MTDTEKYAGFLESLNNAKPPGNLTAALLALWYDARGDWDRAHQAIQSESDKQSAWVHAYLHRKEGDLSNARYWYQEAGETLSRVSFEEEWSELLRRFLK